MPSVCLPCFLIFAVVLSISTTSGQMDIPKGQLGFVYGGAKAASESTVKVAAFLDLSCPDSQASYPTLTKVADHFGTKVELRVYLFPLPYHRNSHTLSKAANVLNAYFNKTNTPTGKSVYDWFQVVYENLDTLVPSATAHMNDFQVLDIITKLAMQISTISKDAFQAGVSDRTIDVRTRTEWKYGCTRGVYGTPMFTVNDVFVQAEADWTVDQWIKLINTVLQS